MIVRPRVMGMLCIAGLHAGLYAGLYAQVSMQDLMDGAHYKRARAAVEAKYKETPNDAETLCLLSRVRQV